MELVVVDYDAGNIRSVAKAIEHVGVKPVITADIPTILAADGVIVPGVGAAGDIMRSLTRLGLHRVIREVIGRGTPFLGVCMGLQVLLTSSDEDNGQACLDIFPGTVRRFGMGLKVPHMGWNQVRFVHDHPLFAGIPDNSHFYFVHSYYADPEDRAIVAGETDYGHPFASVLIRDNVMATQFHPEKSAQDGLRLYRNFSRIVRDGLLETVAAPAPASAAYQQPATTYSR